MWREFGYSVLLHRLIGLYFVLLKIADKKVANGTPLFPARSRSSGFAGDLVELGLGMVKITRCFMQSGWYPDDHSFQRNFPKRPDGMKF